MLDANVHLRELDRPDSPTVMRKPRRTIDRDDETARKHLLSLCWPSGQPVCPRCSADRIYTLSGGQLRCAQCRYTFQPFSRRWIDNGALSPSQWIRLVRMFIDERSPHAIKKELGLAYNTVYKGLNVIRFAILAHAADARQLMSSATGLDSYLKGQRLTGAPAKMHMGIIPVYGILRRDNMVFVDLMPGLQAETIFHFHMNFHLKLIRSGNLIYTDRYREYDAMILCGNNTLPYGVIKKRHTPPFIDTAKDEFWITAKDRFKQFRGISCQRFPLYLKELEFRFNHLGQDIFDILLKYLCDYVPSQD